MGSLPHSHPNGTASSPYHILVIHLVRADGSLGGGYRIEPMEFTSIVIGRSGDHLRNECFELLESVVQVVANAPFDTTELRKSVAFDFVECLNEDDYEMVLQMEGTGDTFENVFEAFQQWDVCQTECQLGIHVEGIVCVLSLKVATNVDEWNQSARNNWFKPSLMITWTTLQMLLFFTIHAGCELICLDQRIVKHLIRS